MLDTVLIVDNDAAQRYLAESAIAQRLKYRTISVSSGREAVQMVMSGLPVMPDVMLLDMRLGEAEVLSIVQAVKAQRPEFPIILLTEYGEQRGASQAIQAGANDFLTKPVAMERLGLSLANALRIRQLHQMVEQLQGQLVRDGVPASYTKPGLGMLTPSPLGRDGKVKKMHVLEEEAIRFALSSCDGSMSKAARSLGIGRSTLYRKVSELERMHQKTAHNARDTQTIRPTIDISSIER